jgi:hypothetical protein
MSVLGLGILAFNRHAKSWALQLVAQLPATKHLLHLPCMGTLSRLFLVWDTCKYGQFEIMPSVSYIGNTWFRPTSMAADGRKCDLLNRAVLNIFCPLQRRYHAKYELQFRPGTRYRTRNLAPT